MFVMYGFVLKTPIFAIVLVAIPHKLTANTLYLKEAIFMTFDESTEVEYSFWDPGRRFCSYAVNMGGFFSMNI